MAITPEPLNTVQHQLIAVPAPGSWLQRLIDTGLYIPQTLNPTQLATLDAIAHLLFVQPTSKYLASRLDAALVSSATEGRPLAPLPPITFDYQVGLDELDHISRTRTSYSFAELPTDLQEAMLSLVATRDLTTRKLDLALWLDNLRRHAVTTV